MGGLLGETSQPAGWDHYQDDEQQPYQFLRNDLADDWPGPARSIHPRTSAAAARSWNSRTSPWLPRGESAILPAAPDAEVYIRDRETALDNTVRLAHGRRAARTLCPSTSKSQPCPPLRVAAR